MTASWLDIENSTIALTSGKARLWAILVGVNAYQDSRIPVLHYSAADCFALANVLVTATQQFPKKRIISHHDFAAQMPVREAVLASFAQVVERAKPQDTVLFYFSGHGLIEPKSKRAVLCLSDTQTDQLLDTGLQMHELLQQLDQCESRQQLVWLDACHSGELMIPGARNVVFNTAADETTTTILQLLRQQAVQNKGLYALLSCDQGQRSWEFPELGHGLFTYYLIQGLQGEAADATGVISADGLYQYLYEHITQFIDQKNQTVRRLNEQRLHMGEVLMHPEYPLQTPKRIVDGVGNVVVGMVVGMQKRAKLSPSSAPTPAQQVAPQPLEAAKTVTNRSINWRYWLWGWGTALAAGGLYLGLESLLPRSTDPSVSLPITSPITSPNDSSDVCNLNIDLTEPIAQSVLEPQIVLNRCGSQQPWQPVKAQAWLEGDPVWAVAFAGDDSRLLSGSGNIVKLRDLSKQEPSDVLGNHTNSVYDVAASPSHKLAATASADQTAKIWDISQRTLKHILKDHSAAIWSVAFSPDGSTIATGSVDKTIKLWNTSTGRLESTFTGHQDWVFAVAFNPSGDVLATASKDGTIKLWDLNGTELNRLTGHKDAVRAIAFSPDGTKLASTSWDRTVRIWDTQTGQMLHTLNGHTDRVVAVGFSPDGDTLASGSIDQTIKLWRSADGALLGTLYGQTDWVLSLDFSPDGKTLVSGSRDQTILLWQK
ncbi:MAG: hypothetical protein HC827_21505 [Cyanobacteria bacterium RM1_2_2]|nr:hypothetical protein [Cyanobacteria bacterium RM1_2_2]